MNYTPDNWVIVKIARPESVVYKVLAGWSGGYLDGNSWRLNSGIVRANREGDYIIFEGHSGSQYKCHKNTQRLSGATASIYESLRQQGEQQGITVEMVDEFQG